MTTDICMLIKINVMYEKIFILRRIYLPALSPHTNQIFFPLIFFLLSKITEIFEVIKLGILQPVYQIS